MIDRLREWFARHERVIEGIIRNIIFPVSLGIFITILLRVYFLGHL